MSPSSQSTSPAAATLPPLPPSSDGASPDRGPGEGGAMASLMTGIAPIKSAVDSILAACRGIVQSGAIPGSEQVCGQIISLAASLLPMAAQSLVSPGPVQPMRGAPQQGAPGAPPMGGPPPM